jgi:ABC-2 type transport system ATP-binding protein
MKLSASRLSKRFGKLLALDQLSFELPAGRALALVGPNGSGKSTLIRVLVGLLSSEGEVLFDGARRTPDTARQIAYVPQIAPKLAAPVNELVRAIAGVRGITPAEVGRVAGTLSLDLDSIAKMPFANLSGGTKQKLLLALALSSPVSLYILDEPTASLDTASRANFFRVFRQHAAGASLILCSHRLEEITHLVDHVIELQDGKIAYAGPVRPYLSTKHDAVIELRVSDQRLDPWLRDRGFSQHGEHSWGKSVGRHEKLVLLQELTKRLNGQLENIQIRDLEQIDAEPAASDNCHA